MNCARLRQMLDAWLDKELDRATSEEIEQHIGACATCATLKNERLELRQRVRAEAPYFRAPAALERTVRRSLVEAMDEPVRQPRGLTWLQAGALTAIVAVVSAGVGYWMGRPLPDSSLREQVVASHVASLATSRRLTEVASADRHVVKPWFQGKLDFAPVVRDLSGVGYTLLGARLDHVADRQAAAVAYRVRNHVINLFVWRAPLATGEPLALSAARGFNLATWSDAGLAFAAVSDVDARDLERFARLVQAQP